ncbi:metal ABC transporter substrate-binding protein [Microbacterium caowuchunii]|uniref:metal ABC transporter solute-binding protein, Zn/Mn family n=1 Tax=Microbacterium caowuchunii TaxID=2614638 RepID=UPI0012466DF6|nr:zinc ABC transporter substrate-binding protein [Microbacterium caowuchunii]QEW01291.1 metal ABC transporter substrate-binding protein [Microbacterium caowuchunii]
MSRTPRLVLPALAAASVLALAGCSSATADPAGDADAFTIVASTDVYGQIAEAIAGDAAEVTAIITSAAQDPHGYEPTAADQLTVQRADLLIENGGGYDAFMDALIEAGGTDAPVISAVEYAHDWPGADDDAHADDAHADDAHADDAHADDAHADDAHADDDHADDEHAHDEDEHGHTHIEGFNEHVWYDPHTIEHVAEAIAAQLSVQLPDDADAIEANAQAFIAELEGLEAALAEIEAAHAGERVFVTEPAPGYLVAAAGLVDVTPAAFSEAVEEGQDVAPATLLAALEAVRSGDVRVVIANAQTGGAETTQLIDAAAAADIPVLEFTETLPEGQTYIPWMQQNIEELAGALAS